MFRQLSLKNKSRPYFTCILKLSPIKLSSIVVCSNLIFFVVLEYYPVSFANSILEIKINIIFNQTNLISLN